MLLDTICLSAKLIVFILFLLAAFALVDYIWRKRHYVVAGICGLIALISLTFIAHLLSGGFLVTLTGFGLGCIAFWLIIQRVEVYGIFTEMPDSEQQTVEAAETRTHPGKHNVDGFWRTSVLGNVHYVRSHVRSNPAWHPVEGHARSRKREPRKYYSVGTRWFWLPVNRAFFADESAMEPVTHRELEQRRNEETVFRRYERDYNLSERLKLVLGLAFRGIQNVWSRSRRGLVSR